MRSGCLSLEPSDPEHSMLLAPSSQPQADMLEEGEDFVCSEPSQPTSPTYKELLDVMACAMTRIDLVWVDTGSNLLQTQQAIPVSPSRS